MLIKPQCSKRARTLDIKFLAVSKNVSAPARENLNLTYHGLSVTFIESCSEERRIMTNQIFMYNKGLRTLCWADMDCYHRLRASNSMYISHQNILNVYKEQGR
jgi:uncharacterized protein YbgA (DUF1722 family)